MQEHHGSSNHLKASNIDAVFFEEAFETPMSVNEVTNCRHLQTANNIFAS